MIDPSPTFDPVALLDLLEKEQITTCFLVPSQCQAVCAAPGIKDRKLALRTPRLGRPQRAALGP
ncbi:hypothetical protein [Streptomyces sp. NPDC050145]|uniref:hypothetical protein n=1 Tax=Streptomyces sp. NPDC050145 TaxID=3365602 RepID=UPI0037A8CC19